MFDLFKNDDDVINYLVTSSEFDNKKDEVDRLKNLGLTDEEIRLVIEEGYAPEDFEDDEGEEKDDDDYYGEDF